MGIFGYIIIGLIAGTIGKAIMKRGGGWGFTLLIGVIGAVIGGWLGTLLFNRPLTEFWSIYTWSMATLGSVIVLFVLNRLGRRR